MLSSALIILTWWLFAIHLKRGKEVPESLLVFFSFILTVSCLFLAYFLAIALMPVAIFRITTFVYLCVIACHLFLIRREASESVQVLRNALFLNGPTGHSFNKSTPAVNSPHHGLTKIRILLIYFIVAVLFLRGIFTLAPTNFDSSTYNISRIPAMILSGTPFLSSTGSARQAIFSLGHDLLYFPDIAFNNLRGLPLVNSIEFIVILAALLRLTLYCLSDLHTSAKPRGSWKELSLLISTCMLISADGLVFQSASAKNDLIIVCLFLISLVQTIYFLRDNSDFAFGTYLTFSILILALAVSSKAYGLIVIAPQAIVLGWIVLHLLIRLLKGSSTNRLNIWSQHSDRFEDVEPCLSNTSSKRIGARRVYWDLNVKALAWIIISSLASIYFAHRWFISEHYRGAVLSEITSRWTNTSGTLAERLLIMILNSTRIILGFFAYPYSTILKPNPQGPNDFLFGPEFLTRFLNFNGFGIVKPYQFNWPRYENIDKAFTSPLFHFLILLSIVSIVHHYFGSEKRSQDFILFSRNPLKLDSIKLISLSSFLTFIMLNYALLFNTWVYRYYGAAYIGLVPIVSTLSSAFILSWIPATTKPIEFRRILSIAVIFMIVVAAMFQFSKIENLKAVIGAAGLPAFEESAKGEFPTLDTIYNGYLGSNGFGPEKMQALYSSFEKNTGGGIAFCYYEDSPTLLPLMNALKNYRQGDVRLLSHSSPDCKTSKLLTAQGDKLKVVHLP